MGVWNPWRGCKKCSEGCLHCYIHKGDAKRGVDTSDIVKTKDFDKPTASLIVKGVLKCPKWMVICNPLVMTIIYIPVVILLSGTGFEGIAEAFESLGEGLVYVAVYAHLKSTS